jgi:hypothetical protein
MTSILKQNTMCFALPLCRKYRQRARMISITSDGNIQLEEYSGAGRETMMAVAVLSAAEAIRYRVGAVVRPDAGAPIGPTTFSSFGSLPRRSNWTGVNTAAASGETSVLSRVMRFGQFVSAGISHAASPGFAMRASQPLYQQH